MHDTTQRRAIAVYLLTAGLAVSGLALPGIMGGCANPLAGDDGDYDRRVPVSRLRSIQALPIDSYGAAEEEVEEDASVSLARAVEDVEAARVGLDERDRADLSIEEIRAATLSNNLDLRVVLIDPEIEAQRVSEEEGAFEAILAANATFFNNDDAVALATQSGQADGFNFSPSLTIPLRTGGEFELSNPISRTNNDNPFATLNPAATSDLQVSLSQNLLRGAGRRANVAPIRIADLNRQAVEASTKLQVIQTLSDAERAYWRLYAQQEALNVRIQQYELAQEQLTTAERRFNVGAVAEIEVIRAESGLADRVEQLIASYRDVLLAQRELKRIANIPGLDIDSETFVSPISDPDPVRYELDGTDLAERALDRRMELLELELRLAADEATESLRRNEALPLLNATLTYRLNGLGNNVDEAIRVSSENRFTDWAVGLNAELPLGNESRNARVRQAVLSRLRRLSSREARRQAVRQEVLDAVDRINAGWQRIIAAQRAVILNTRTLEAERRQFEVGRSTSDDVLDADTTLAEARLTEIQAIVDYQISQIDLAVATGTLLGASRVDWSPIDPRDWRESNDNPPPEFYVPPMLAPDAEPDVAPDAAPDGEGEG